MDFNSLFYHFPKKYQNKFTWNLSVTYVLGFGRRSGNALEFTALLLPPISHLCLCWVAWTPLPLLTPVTESWIAIANWSLQLLGVICLLCMNYGSFIMCIRSAADEPGSHLAISITHDITWKHHDEYQDQVRGLHVKNIMYLFCNSNDRLLGSVRRLHHRISYTRGIQNPQASTVQQCSCSLDLMAQGFPYSSYRYAVCKENTKMVVLLVRSAYFNINPYFVHTLPCEGLQKSKISLSVGRCYHISPHT